MPLSVRLDAKTERLIDRLARTRGQTKSEVIREAIAALARLEGKSLGGKSPYETIAHLIGCVRGGPRDLSVRTGEKFRRLLLEKRAGRKGS
jgi:hypothetical protein